LCAAAAPARLRQHPVMEVKGNDVSIVDVADVWRCERLAWLLSRSLGGRPHQTPGGTDQEGSQAQMLFMGNDGSATRRPPLPR
jgi:hypothetical protein